MTSSSFPMHPTKDDTVRTTPDDVSDNVPNNDLPNTNLNVLAYWSSTAAALLIVLAVCFALCSFSTNLETFLAQHLAIFFIAIAITLVVNIPSSTPPPLPAEFNPNQPLLVPLSAAAIISAFFAWNSRATSPLVTLFFLVDIVIGLWGLWALVFNGPAVLSKTTGADKHTSSFIFGNKASASKQKKRWKSERRRE
ncbi:uncharacterized protein LACBIDRAFT_306033 [Laccaria bicolor S238N-H82]|uniref:Predicted protein n=1 Tax=Laccaria bicolor (strain S238N-H82 / ATCC MYA-4686) TaxID=486041 RepID=B0CSJ9_LACBS|nr:uncharacterized protein LACBIDRAFT_306033 [Laccaria bicolor S238N-H82]EDR14321.1 predicted protein [Laccaria bicolor S238N-H82]|eukprot:XP_001874880.1 predicted protein [Laccaria bicolor S238N-H82]